jgi:hypothetical protein
MDIEKRVNISLAVGRYVGAAQRFENACKEFNESCQDLRVHFDEQTRLIVKHSYEYYLVTSDKDGNFEVEKVDAI